MKILNGILYIELGELVAAGIKANTIKSGIKRGAANWCSIKDPADQRRSLLAYEKLGGKYKDAIKAQFGDVYNIANTQELDTSWKLGEQLALSVKIDEQEYADLLRRLPAEEALERARACGWLRLIGSLRKKQDLALLGFKSKSELYRVAISRLQKEQVKGLNISNKKVLQRKVSAYKKEGWRSLMHGLKGNDNAAKLRTEEQRQHLLALMCDPHKADVDTVTYLYNKHAAKQGWAMIDPNTARRYLNQGSVKRVWFRARHGKDAYYQKYDLSIPRLRPTRIDALWVLDGTPLDLYFQRKVDKYDAKTKKWTTRTTRYNRMDMILVADAASWRIISGVLCEHENADSVRLALKEAVRQNMRLPKQLTYDQGSGMAAQKWMLDRLNILNTPTRPYNAKAKVIENIIGHFQTKILRYYDNWAGMGVRTRKLDSHFNPEFLASIKEDLPDLEQLQLQFEEAIRIWNELSTKKRKAPNVAYAQGKQAGRSIDVMEFVELFWQKRKHYYEYKDSGITIEINTKRYQFLITDPQLVKQVLGNSYQLAVDPDCLDFVYLYNGDAPVLDSAGEPIMAINAEQVAVPMAADDYTAGSRTRINKLIALKDEVTSADLEQVKAIRAYASENNINLGARHVYKDQLNDAEAAFKISRIEQGDEWEDILERKYLD